MAKCWRSITCWIFNVVCLPARFLRWIWYGNIVIFLARHCRSDSCINYKLFAHICHHHCSVDVFDTSMITMISKHVANSPNLYLCNWAGHWWDSHVNIIYSPLRFSFYLIKDSTGSPVKGSSGSPKYNPKPFYLTYLLLCLLWRKTSREDDWRTWPLTVCCI